MLSVFRALRACLALAGIALLAACATPLDARRDEALRAKAPVHDRPAVRPVRSVSSFSSSLQCMDRLLREAELPTTLITSKQIPDATGRVPVAAKDMVITALSQMSRLSNAFRYIDYEVDIARQDTVQSLTTILLNNNQLQLQRPALYLSGSIAFLDQNVLATRADAGSTASRLELGYSQNRNASIIGLEMHLGDFRTRTFIPGLDSANEVVFGSGGQGFDLAGRIGDYGVQFNVGRDYTQGSGAAVRTLVELATIELVGKWARVPYWQCLTLAQSHPAFQRQLRDWYDEGGPAVHRNLVQRALVTWGYLPAGPTDDAAGESTLRTALARFQADRGLVVSGTIDFPTYEHVLAAFTELGADGALNRVGWQVTGGGPLARAVPAAPADASRANRPQAAFGDGPPARRLDLQLENIQLDRQTFEPGEQLFFSLVLSRAGHLACYQLDSRGGVSRILPNALTTQTLVSANQAVRIPDWMSPTPGFVLDAGPPGSEGLACIVTDGEVQAALTGDVARTPAFRPIPGIASLEAVVDLYRGLPGAGEIAVGHYRWEVLPKSAAASATPAQAAAVPARR